MEKTASHPVTSVAVMVFSALNRIGSNSSRGLQSHPPVTGVLRWEIRESARGSAPEDAPGNRGAPGVALRRGIGVGVKGVTGSGAIVAQ